ncbi:hypothetical protein PPYR_00868 [Photinus pyralis]|uniref:Copper transport protein n=1 Tax=Photinus pyralis TaxID=7054 RepID=A0A5N4B2Z6_PHOPY|nr:probable low affinity copper uptake protein 2 [Photinus pyralis]KAB0803898.1 hypothetical protein PPYR_00868 [Photinus pyralis]
MHMTFWWDTNIPDLLFYGCNISSKGWLTLTCLILIALGILFEWLKLLQAKQKQRELIIRARQIRTVCPSSETSTLISHGEGTNSQKPSLFVRTKLLFCDACLWINIHVLGYILMLVIMVYNGWLIISLLIGSGIGYFLFGTQFIKITMQNFQTVRDTFCYMNCAEADLTNETEPIVEPSSSHCSSTSHGHTEGTVVVCVHPEPT